MKALFVSLILGSALLHAETADPYEGLWQGYDGEWGHVSRQLVALAEASPPTSTRGGPLRACDRSARS